MIPLVALVVREANATMSLVTNVDSATRSYTAWAKAAEAEAGTVNSATRSYIAQAKAAPAVWMLPTALALTPRPGLTSPGD